MSETAGQRRTWLGCLSLRQSRDIHAIFLIAFIVFYDTVGEMYMMLDVRCEFFFSFFFFFLLDMESRFFFVGRVVSLLWWKEGRKEGRKKERKKETETLHHGL